MTRYLVLLLAIVTAACTKKNDASFDFELLWETLFPKTYNTRLVVVSVTLLSAAFSIPPTHSRTKP